MKPLTVILFALGISLITSVGSLGQTAIHAWGVNTVFSLYRPEEEGHTKMSEIKSRLMKDAVEDGILILIQGYALFLGFRLRKATLSQQDAQ
jgi:hypothetical protein